MQWKKCKVLKKWNHIEKFQRNNSKKKKKACQAFWDYSDFIMKPFYYYFCFDSREMCSNFQNKYCNREFETNSVDVNLYSSLFSQSGILPWCKQAFNVTMWLHMNIFLKKKKPPPKTSVWTSYCLQKDF